MKQHTLVGAGETQNVTRLFSRQALDVAQNEDLLLNRRQLCESRLELVA
jgi:hypothetical protein